jgi:hypothetical protein
MENNGVIIKGNKEGLNALINIGWRVANGEQWSNY